MGLRNSKTVRVGAELDVQTDAKFDRWARAEGLSKRRHAAILLRRLTSLWETDGASLAKLGLAHPGAVAEQATRA